jgi:16S rRNA (cytosine967-C5)-methyltransferase
VLVQRALLDHAATLVKPGGALVYSVCSPMPAEGPQQVEGFLARHAEFTLDPAQRVLPWLPSDAVDALGEIRLRTHLHDADAFFAARLVRRR